MRLYRLIETGSMALLLSPILGGCLPSAPPPTPTLELPTVTPAPTIDATVVAAAPTLVPPTSTAVPPPDEITSEDLTILQVLAGDEDLSDLYQALTAAGLADSLNAPGSYTLFAPVNAAFDNLPEGMMEAFSNDPPSLANLLLYHIVPARITSESFGENSSVATLLTPPLSLTVVGETLVVNRASIIRADILTSNGIIHTTGAVLIPPEAADE